MLELRDVDDDEVIGGLLLDDEYLYVTEGVAADLVDSMRERGLDDPDIYEALDGWSNGYLYIEETDGDTLEAAVESPALTRWLEHFPGLHDQKSHGRRFRIPGDKRSGVLPSVADLRGLAEKKGLTVPKRARKADIAKMLDDAGPRRSNDDLFPGRPRQSEKLDAKLDAAFGPAERSSTAAAVRQATELSDTTGRPSPSARVEAAKADIRSVVTSTVDSGSWLGLADLREQLGTRYSKADVDAALLSLWDDPDVSLTSVANTQALRQRDHDARLFPTIGGLGQAELNDRFETRRQDDAVQPVHAIRIDPKLAARNDRTPSRFLDTSGAKPPAQVAFQVHSGKTGDLTDADLDNALSRLPEGGGDWRAVKAERDRRGGASDGAGAPSMRDSTKMNADEKLAAGRLMFGDDESKWPAHAKRDAARIRARQAAAQAKVGRLEQRLAAARQKAASERAKSREQQRNLQSDGEMVANDRVRRLERELREARQAL